MGFRKSPRTNCDIFFSFHSIHFWDIPNVLNVGCNLFGPCAFNWPAIEKINAILKGPKKKKKNRRTYVALRVNHSCRWKVGNAV